MKSCIRRASGFVYVYGLEEASDCMIGDEMLSGL